MGPHNNGEGTDSADSTERALTDKSKSASSAFDRRSYLKGLGGTITLATFAGCAGNDGDSDGDNGDGDNNGDSTPVPSDGDTVDLGNFEVPAENVVSQSELSEDQEIGNIELMARPTSTNPNAYEALVLLAEESAKLGLDIEVQTSTYSNHLERVYRNRQPGGPGWYQMCYWTFSSAAYALDPDNWLYRMFSVDNQNGYNFSYYENDEYEQLVADQRAETDLESRQELVNEAQRILHEEVPILFYIYPDLVDAWNSQKWEGVEEIAGLGVVNRRTRNHLKPKTDDKDLVAGWIAENEINSLSPFGYAGGMDMLHNYMMWDQLMWPTQDGLAEPRLATEINYLDEKTIEFPLREHKWWDGMELLAEDVKFTYDYHLSDSSSFVHSVVNTIDEVEVADDHRVIFHMKEPYAGIELVALRVYIAQKNHWEEIMDSQAWADHSAGPEYFVQDEIIGSGPQKFEHWRRGDEVKVVKNPDHWDPIEYDSQTVRWFSSVQTALTQLQDGTIDFLYRYAGDKEVLSNTVNDSDHLSMKRSTSLAMEKVYFNNDVPPFHLPSFRRAIAHRMPKDLIVNQIYKGFGAVPNNTPISPAMTAWYNDELEPYAFDLQSAANELVKDGFMWDEEEQRLWMPAGKTLPTKDDVSAALDFGYEREYQE